MLNRDTIVSMFKELGFSKGSYALGTSGALVMFGIKEFANDLDIDCVPELYDSFRGKGFTEFIYTPSPEMSANILNLSEDIQLIRQKNINFGEVVEIDGISVYSVESVRKFKANLWREKDLADIKLIDEYLKNN